MDKFIEIAGIILMIFICFGIHELGHLITGLVQGFKFELFVIGPLGVKKNKNSIKVYLNKNPQYYGGIAATLPVNDSPENEQKFAKLILAGPIASLTFSIVCGLFFLLDEHLLRNIITSGCFISFGVFLATTLPTKTGAFFSDRKRYQRLRSVGIEKEAELAVLRITGIQYRDDSYVNINVQDIRAMINETDPFYKFIGLFTMLNYQFETSGQMDSDTKNEYDQQSKNIPKHLLKQFNNELNKLE